MIILLVVLFISILGILKVLNKMQTVFFLTLALIYYLMKFTNCTVLLPYLDKKDEEILANIKDEDCVDCRVPKDVYMANKKWANFPTLNVHDDYGWGDFAFGSAGGGSNAQIEMPEVGNPQYAWQPPTPEWYGW